MPPHDKKRETERSGEEEDEFKSKGIFVIIGKWYSVFRSVVLKVKKWLLGGHVFLAA
jgi:hypothetical protein